MLIKPRVKALLTGYHSSADTTSKSTHIFSVSEMLTEALDRDWDYESRKFFSSEEKIECDRLELIEYEINAIADIYISKDQHRALALDDDEVSVETKLTKGDAAPPPASKDVFSEMNGSTRESKSKAYADSAVKVVVVKYSEVITNINLNIGTKDDKTAQLELGIKNYRSLHPLLPSQKILMMVVQFPLTQSLSRGSNQR